MFVQVVAVHLVRNLSYFRGKASKILHSSVFHPPRQSLMHLSFFQGGGGEILHSCPLMCSSGYTTSGEVLSHNIALRSLNSIFITWIVSVKLLLIPFCSIPFHSLRGFIPSCIMYFL